MNEDAKRHLAKLDVVWSIPSTNAHCFNHMQSRCSTGVACFAEHQSAGRGRRGRQWASPAAANLYFSIGWRFNGGVETLEGLSLAVGVMIADVLSQDFGVPGIKLKWPNDIFCGQRKLGGVLIEMSGDASGPCDVVIGVGVNVCMPKNTGVEIDQPWTDVCSHTDVVPSRNRMAARFLDQLLPLLATYESRGFAHYRSRWQEYDAFAGQPVVLCAGENQCVAGSAAGVNDSGGLVIDVNGIMRVFKSGEVSLRRD
jgi:BirA family biotin operon repressor/biotin-[acetyl-CoA-carboxylase] ligase